MSLSQEHEVRVLGIDSQEIIARILQHGGVHLWSGFQRRYVFDVPAFAHENRWLRLRENQDGSTLTFKEMLTDGGTTEAEVAVSDFSTTLVILKSLGIFPRAYHETHRQLYRLPNTAAVSIDSWPGLPQFAEIEASDEVLLLEAVRLLGVERRTTTTGIVALYLAQNILDIQHRDLFFSEQEKLQLQ